MIEIKNMTIRNGTIALSQTPLEPENSKARKDRTIGSQ